MLRTFHHYPETAAALSQRGHTPLDNTPIDEVRIIVSIFQMLCIDVFSIVFVSEYELSTFSGSEWIILITSETCVFLCPVPAVPVLST